MKDGDGSDVLTLNEADLTNIIGDNSLDFILSDNPGREKMIINGDQGDVVNLDGESLGSVENGILGGNWGSDFVEADYLGDGEMYLLITNYSSLDLYVHASLVENTFLGESA